MSEEERAVPNPNPNPIPNPNPTLNQAQLLYVAANLYFKGEPFKVPEALTQPEPEPKP